MTDANWWLGVVEPATLHATRPECPEPERRAWTRLAVTALETARATGGLSGREVAARMAHLCRALARYGPPEGFAPELRPERVARACLSVAGMTAAEAAATPWRPRAEDVAAMRDLRRVRNVIAPAVQLAEHVDDRRTRDELAAWRDVLSRLP
jgi:hypothetical protein